MTRFQVVNQLNCLLKICRLAIYTSTKVWIGVNRASFSGLIYFCALYSLICTVQLLSVHCSCVQLTSVMRYCMYLSHFYEQQCFSRICIVPCQFFSQVNITSCSEFMYFSESRVLSSIFRLFESSAVFKSQR